MAKRPTAADDYTAALDTILEEQRALLLSPVQPKRSGRARALSEAEVRLFEFMDQARASGNTDAAALAAFAISRQVLEHYFAAGFISKVRTNEGARKANAARSKTGDPVIVAAALRKRGTWAGAALELGLSERALRKAYPSLRLRRAMLQAAKRPDRIEVRKERSPDRPRSPLASKTKKAPLARA